MKKAREGALIPKLRFPEFLDEGEWELKKLCDKDVSDFVKKRVPLSELTIDTYVSTENILPDFGGITKSSKLPSSGSFTAYRSGDILIANIRPYLKKIWVANRSGAASNDVLVIRPKTRNENLFLASILKNDVFINYVMESAKGVKMPRGDISLMEDYPLAMPNRKEQKKIADCLSSIDALITAHGKKLDMLNAHKKGLMQQLFPSEGEATPKFRFPEFRDSGKWEEKQLKDACQMQAGKFVRASDIHENTKDGLYPCYGGNGLRGYTETYTHEGKYSLIGRQGALCGNVTLALGKFHATEHAVVATPKEGVNTDWLYYKLTRLNLNHYATGQAQPGLSVENLEKVDIEIPIEENEQKKIADCLSFIDALITEQSKKLDALKAHIKGLMQQLFPSVS